MAVTQKMIAKKVGVTQKTVSLYFSGSKLISPKTREHIKQVSEALGYFPNLAAQSIKTKRFKRIALAVVQQYQAGRQNHPQILSYINAVAEELAKNGYSLVHEPFNIDIATLDFVEEPNFFKSLSVDGIIGVAGTYVPPVIDDTIASMKAPVVWLNRQCLPADIPGININEQANGRQLAEYLCDKGYKRVIWFGPEYEKDVARHFSSLARYKGAKQVFQEKGLELTNVFARIGENLTAKASKLFTNKPEAVICYNFGYADSALFQIMRKGLRHPEDVEIVRFSSPWETALGTSHLFTQLLLPEIDISHNGAKFILSIINNKRDDKYLAAIQGKLLPRKTKYSKSD